MKHKNLRSCSQTHKEQRGTWENVPLGLQLLRVRRNDVICFYKTQFKFVPAFPELQQSASVETFCSPYFRMLECTLHHNPTNRCVLSCPSQFSFVSPTWRQCVLPVLDHCSAPSSCVLAAEPSPHALNGLKENNAKRKPYFWSPTLISFIVK